MRDGTYNNVAVISGELIESKEKRTPGVELLFQLSDEDGGEQIRGTLWLSEGAIKRSVESLRHTGWQGDDLSELSTVGSKLCQIVVETEEYNGRGYPRVKWVNANESAGGGGAGQARMSDVAKKQFAAKMRGLVIAVSGGKPSAAVNRGSGGAPRPSANSNAPAGPPAPPAGYVPEEPPLAPTGSDPDPF